MRGDEERKASCMNTSSFAAPSATNLGAISNAVNEPPFATRFARRRGIRDDEPKPTPVRWRGEAREAENPPKPEAFQQPDPIIVVTSEYEKLKLSFGSQATTTPQINRSRGSRGNGGGGGGQPRPARTLNPNYNWREDDGGADGDGDDYDDDDDDDYQLHTPGRRLNDESDMEDVEAIFDSEEDELESDEEGYGGRGRGARRRGRGNLPDSPQRTSARNEGRERRRYDVPDSDDELINEIESAAPRNAVPVAKLRDVVPEGTKVDDAWARRTERVSNAFFCPQQGDSVVYLPRQHFQHMVDTNLYAKEYPWENFKKISTDKTLNAIRCKVQHLRWSYTAEEAGCDGVVATLTLKFTGLPEEREARTVLPVTSSRRRLQSRAGSDFPWPR